MPAMQQYKLFSSINRFDNVEFAGGIEGNHTKGRCYQSPLILASDTGCMHEAKSLQFWHVIAANNHHSRFRHSHGTDPEHHFARLGNKTYERAPAQHLCVSAVHHQRILVCSTHACIASTGTARFRISSFNAARVGICFRHRHAAQWNLLFRIRPRNFRSAASAYRPRKPLGTLVSTQAPAPCALPSDRHFPHRRWNVFVQQRFCVLAA